MEARQRARADEESSLIAQRVYHAARELKSNDEPDPLPLAIFAPLTVAAETAAPGALKLAGIEPTEELALELAAYFVAGFREMVVMLDPAHFEAWRNETNASATDDASEGAGEQ